MCFAGRTAARSPSELLALADRAREAAEHDLFRSPTDRAQLLVFAEWFEREAWKRARRARVNGAGGRRSADALFALLSHGHPLVGGAPRGGG
jgi:hypothetical protein